MKKKLLISFVILGIGILIFLLFERSIKAINLSEGQIEDVYIEVLSEDEKSVEKVAVDKNDIAIIKDIVIGEEIIPDNGFPFAPGGYRIVICTDKEVLHFYPYCGVGSTIRVGDEGFDFIWLEDNEAEKLNQIMDKYKNGKEGIWDWSSVKDKEQADNIEQIIKKAICIQYGWGNINELNQLCTEEFLNGVDLDEIYLGRKLYTIEKGYTDNVREVSGNELEVTVSVYSPDIMFHHFTLTRDEDGKFLINNIEHDM